MTSSTAGWVSTSLPKEIERLTQLLWHYETVNLDQKNQLDNLVTSRDNLVDRIQKHDQEDKRKAKQFRSLELQLKYEKSASEGLRKKTGHLEKELMDLKEVLDKSQNHENDLGRRRVTLEEELKEERAYRLQLVHEKEKLREEIVRLTSLLQQIEKQNVETTQRVLDLQQQLETSNSRADRQEKLIKVQSEEIVSLNAELMRLKERFMGKTRDLLEEQRSHADYHFTMDKMQEEISYLRKELTVSNQDQSIRNIASSINQKKTREQNATTKLVNTKTSQRYNVSHFREDGTFSRVHQQQSASSSSLATSSLMNLESKSKKRKKILDSPPDEDTVSPQSPRGKSWISDSFPPQSLKEFSSEFRQMGRIASPQSRSSTANRSKYSGSHPLLSPLATRDRPRDSLNFAQPNVDVDNETQAYFNNPDRVALLHWIRTTSRQSDRSERLPQQSSSAERSVKQDPALVRRVTELKQVYQQPSKESLNSITRTGFLNSTA